MEAQKRVKEPDNLYAACYLWLESESDAECIQTLEDVARHGADCGYVGFTLYSDTIAFYDRFERLIWEALEEDANSQGVNVMTLIGTFKTQPSDLDTFKNLLAWYALEHVAYLVGE